MIDLCGTLPSALLSAAISAVIIITKDFHGRFTLDLATPGTRRYHSTPTPRVGGIPILLALFFSNEVLALENQNFIRLLLATIFPVFTVGLLEDTLKCISYRLRFAASFSTGALLYLLLDTSLADIFTLEGSFLNPSIIGISLACVCLSGSTNAINIIDGVHGLASGTAMIICVTLAIIARAVGDPLIFDIAALTIACTAGFFLCNYPSGKIFLGDCGAYFLGALVGVATILLVARNGTVSPISALTILFYPCWETISSMIRRFAHKAHVAMPDEGHLHSLLFKYMERQLAHTKYHDSVNALTALPILIFQSFFSILTVFTFESVRNSLALLACGAVTYVLVWNWLKVRIKPR
jgi:UDP-N-acetylmuramyl pentapeptide phosphotransferase/UDP-N-acetylglucosamine-1-phosphate transferase